MDDAALEETLDNFRKVQEWAFNGYADSSSRYLRSMLDLSVVPALEKAVLVGVFWRDRHSFLSTLLKATFTSQTPVGVVMALCILFGCFLPGIFGIIIVYRKKQRRRDSRLFIKGRISLWATFVVFALSSMLALVSAIVLGIAASRGYFTLVVPFKFAEKSVQSAFSLSGMLHPLFENYIREMSHNTFESSLALYKVDEEVGSEYLDRMHRVFYPVFEIASTLNYQMTQALEKLSHHYDHLPQTLNRTCINLKRLSKRYKDALGNVQKASDSAELDAIAPLPEFEVSSESVQTLEGPIALMRNFSKINLQLGFREMNNQLEDIAYQEYFDPTDLVSEVRHFAFEVENRLSLIIDDYLAFVEEGFRSDKDTVTEIQSMESDAMNGAFPIFCFLIVVSLLCMVFVFAVATVYVAAFVSALRQSRRDDYHWKYQVHCGRFLLYCSFFNTCLLILMWGLSLVLFLFSLVAMGGCVCVRDMSIFGVTFDDKVFHEKPHWFNMFSSDEFNMTMKETVEDCVDGTAYVLFIPSDIPTSSDAKALVAGVNYSSIADSVRNRIQNLTGYNDSFFSIPSNMSSLLDDVDVRPIFDTMRTLQEKVVSLNALRVLKKLYKRIKDEEVKKEIDIAGRAYQDILFNLGTVIAVEKEFNDSLLTVRHLLMTYEKGLDDMVKTSASLLSNVVNSSPHVYESTMQNTVSKRVDQILFEMRLTITNFRKEIAFCKYLMLFYNVMESVFCNVLLFPVVTAWKVTLLLCFFFVFMIAATVLPLHVFLDEVDFRRSGGGDDEDAEKNEETGNEMIALEKEDKDEDAEKSEVDNDENVDETEVNEEETEKNEDKTKKNVDEAQKDEEETKKNVDEAQKDEEETKKNVDEAQKDEEETKKNVDEAQKDEEETKKNVDEAQKDEEETKKNVDEAQKDEEETKKNVDETEMTVIEAQKNLDEAQDNVIETQKLLDEAQKNLDEAQKNADETQDNEDESIASDEKKDNDNNMFPSRSACTNCFW